MIGYNTAHDQIGRFGEYTAQATIHGLGDCTKFKFDEVMARLLRMHVSEGQKVIRILEENGVDINTPHSER